MAAGTPEQLDAVTVLDALNDRSESPLSKSGAWAKPTEWPGWPVGTTAGAAVSGQGWKCDEYSAALWQTGFSGGLTLAATTIGAHKTESRALHLGASNSSEGLFALFAAGNTLYLGQEESLFEGIGITYEEGMRVGLAYDPTTKEATLWLKPVGGIWEALYTENGVTLAGELTGISNHGNEGAADTMFAGFGAEVIEAPELEVEPADSRWDLDGDATDSVGTNDGELVGDPGFADALVTSEPDGKSVVLNGTDQYVRVPDAPSLRLNGSYTLTGWFSIGSITGTQELIRKSGEYRLFLSGDAVHLEHVDAKAAEQAMSADTELLVGRIYRIDAEYDEAAEAMRIYVNGRLIEEQTGISEPPNPSSSDLLFGSRDGEDRFEKGGLDKVRVRSEALGADAILAEFREESDTVWKESFEIGDLSLILEPQGAGGGELAVVEGPPAPAEGSYELEAKVPPEGQRAELRVGHIRHSAGDDIYTRFRFYLKEGFAPTGWGAVVFQTRQEEEPEEKGADSPLVALYALPEDPDDPKSPVHLAVQRGEVLDIEVSPEIYWLGPEIETGRWYDACIRVKYSEDPAKGLVEVWLDGAKQDMLATAGRTARGETYPKFGLYRDTAITTEGIVFHDEIAITRSSPFAPPSVVTGAATGITPVSATLNGTVNPNGLPTTYWFEYGETEAYGSTTPKVEGLEETAAVAAEITGLHPHTTYHFRLVAENEEGEAAGDDATFETAKPVRVAVTREFPPDRLAVRIADPQTGATIARFAEDEAKAENVISGLTKTGEMSGGHKEAGGSLARDPCVDYPDLAIYNDLYIEGAGGESTWEGSLLQAPESDGERLVIEPKAVGHQAALEDRNGLRLGLLDSDQSKWSDPSTARRLALIKQAVDLVASTSVGFSSTDPEAAIAAVVKAAVVNDFTNTEKREGHSAAGEADYSSGGIDIGRVLYDYRQLSDFPEDANWQSDLALGITDTFADFLVGADHNRITALQQELSAGGASGYKFARLRDRQNGPESGPLSDITAWQNLKVLSLLAAENLSLLGAWPEVGYTSKQILQLIVPLYSYLEAQDEDLVDDGYVITQAWYSDPTDLGSIVKDVLKYGVLRWFVLNGKRFELRAPGTFGREWQAYVGASELKETGEDGSRLWDKLVVSYQDVDGRTYTVGYPGSGADFEYAALEITDPEHPAVKAGRTREDLLVINGISTSTGALDAGERWLAEANEISHAGEATLRGYIQDSAGIYRPVSQVQPGDRIRFPDAGSGGTGYREIVAVSYDHDSRTATVNLDAPSEAVQALFERFQAALEPLGL